jgi:hypothetical protein
MIRPSLRRYLGGLVAAGGTLFLFCLLLIGGIRERWAARAAFPQDSGRITVPGLSAEVSIFRDEHGIAHAEARSRADALRALGFIHAQDRLAQMLWLSRLARGRTAELIGPAGLPADRLARALNLSGAAETDLSRLSPDARAALEAYADGVNAGMEQLRSGEVDAPIAMQRLGMALEPWRPVDSLAVEKFYAWGLSSSIEASLVLWDLQERLGGNDSSPSSRPRGRATSCRARPGASRRDSRAAGPCRRAPRTARAPRAGLPTAPSASPGATRCGAPRGSTGRASAAAPGSWEAPIPRAASPSWSRTRTCRPRSLRSSTSRTCAAAISTWPAPCCPGSRWSGPGTTRAWPGPRRPRARR